MTTTIDAAGRVVIPKKAREAAGLLPGTHLEVKVIEGIVQLQPVGSRVRLKRQGRFLVAVPEEPREPLRAGQVRATLEEVRGGGKRSPGGRKHSGG